MKNPEEKFYVYSTIYRVMVYLYDNRDKSYCRTQLVKTLKISNKAMFNIFNFLIKIDYVIEEKLSSTKYYKYNYKYDFIDLFRK